MDTDIILDKLETLGLDNPVLLRSENRTHRVAHEGVKVAVSLLRLSLVPVIEAA